MVVCGVNSGIAVHLSKNIVTTPNFVDDFVKIKKWFIICIESLLGYCQLTQDEVINKFFPVNGYY